MCRLTSNPWVQMIPLTLLSDGDYLHVLLDLASILCWTPFKTNALSMKNKVETMVAFPSALHEHICSVNTGCEPPLHQALCI